MELVPNALLVKENLVKWKLVPSSLCSIYKQASESVEHTLLLCPWMKPVWFKAQLQFIPSLKNISSIGFWLESKFKDLAGNKEIRKYG